MKTISKKNIAYIVIMFIILCNLAILISGKTYLYSAMLHGFADINDYNMFPSRTVMAGKANEWQCAEPVIIKTK